MKSHRVIAFSSSNGKFSEQVVVVVAVVCITTATVAGL